MLEESTLVPSLIVARSPASQFSGVGFAVGTGVVVACNEDAGAVDSACYAASLKDEVKL